MEANLGNNPELEDKVGEQLAEYVRRMTRDLPTFARCYEKQYEPFRAMGFPDHLPHGQIEIQRPVRGCVAVGGRSLDQPGPCVCGFMMPRPVTHPSQPPSVRFRFFLRV